MFMRLLHLTITVERQSEFLRLYEEEILPTLQEVEGCRYAGLVQNVQRQGEGMSLTFWDTKDHAEAYEQSGTFQRLLERSRPFFSDSDEWKIQLSENMQLEYAPVPTEPVLKSYIGVSRSDESIAGLGKSTGMYLRIVSMLVQPGRREEFKALYHRDILPALRSARGCHYVHLAENASAEEEFLSITVWRSGEDADQYETSGLFSSLLEKIRPTLSVFYQWKMELDRESGRQAVTSEDLAVKRYSIVVGRSFR
jgi:quinol monooxygenase YgiN